MLKTCAHFAAINSHNTPPTTVASSRGRGQSKGRGKGRSIGRGRAQPTPQGMPSARTRSQYESQN
jgi:hypothetical protein